MIPQTKRYFWRVRLALELISTHSAICWSLLLKLIGFLSKGTKTWFVMFARLVTFVVVLLPGFLRMLWYYLFDPLIIRNIEYGAGSKQRNLLDVYIPQPRNPGGRNFRRGQQGAPIIVFLSGGAWIIGYKMWNALMGRELSRAGYVVVVPDYRNFPQGNIEDMMTDLREALLWTVCNARMFGGDPDKIVLAGQSAGAHISLCTLVELFEEAQLRTQKEEAASLRSPFELRGIVTTYDTPPSLRPTRLSVSSSPAVSPIADDPNTSSDIWRDVATPHPLRNGCAAASMLPPLQFASSLPQEEVLGITCAGDSLNVTARQNVSDSEHSLHISDIKLFLGVSGPYNLLDMMHHLHVRGLDSSIIDWVCNSEVAKYSPTLRLAEIVGINLPWSVSEPSLKDDRIAYAHLKQRTASDASSHATIPLGLALDAHHRNGSKHSDLSCSSRAGTLPGFPRVALYHGMLDRSIPTNVCTELATVLAAGEVPVTCRMYPDWAHTDPILEGPLGGDDTLVADITSTINETFGLEDEWRSDIAANPKHAAKPMVGDINLQIAKFINPF